MTATHEQNSTIPTTPVLYFSLELGSKNWKLVFTIGLGQKPRWGKRGTYIIPSRSHQ